jgi:hypothetical protein
LGTSVSCCLNTKQVSVYHIRSIVSYDKCPNIACLSRLLTCYVHCFIQCRPQIGREPVGCYCEYKSVRVQSFLSWSHLEYVPILLGIPIRPGTRCETSNFILVLVQVPCGDKGWGGGGGYFPWVLIVLLVRTVIQESLFLFPAIREISLLKELKHPNIVGLQVNTPEAFFWREPSSSVPDP